MQFTIRNINVYRQPERAVLTFPYHLLSFHVRGLRHIKTSGFEAWNPQPYFHINGRGVSTEFDYGPDRENWAAILDSEDIRASREEGRSELRYRGHWISVASITPAPAELVAGWQMEWMLLRDLFRNPVPSNLLRLDLGIANMFRYILDRNMNSVRDSPAAHLKRLMDDDRDGTYSLAALSRQVGYSADHIRALFRQAYGMSPQRYRQRRRMALAMELIADSRLAVKEIVFRLHFRYLSHFSASFRETFGLTPREAIRRFRHSVVSFPLPPEHGNQDPEINNPTGNERPPESDIRLQQSDGNKHHQHGERHRRELPARGPETMPGFISGDDTHHGENRHESLQLLFKHQNKHDHPHNNRKLHPDRE